MKKGSERYPTGSFADLHLFLRCNIDKNFKSLALLHPEILGKVI